MAYVSETQRTRVWEEWLSAEIRSSYFADLSSTLSERQRGAHWVCLLGASGSVSALLAQAPSWIAPVCALIVAGVSAYSIVAQNQKRSADATDLHFRWNTLASEYQDLWVEIEEGTAEGVSERLKAFAARDSEASRAACGFREDKQRMLRWTDEVFAQHHVGHASGHA